MTDWTRRVLSGAALGLVAAGAGGRVGAQAVPVPPGPGPDFGADSLNRGRLTVPVRIDGRGPFTFAVDSAANASVIAADLADALALTPDGEIAMHTLIAREIVGTVRARRLQTGALDVASPRLAVASRAGMDGLDGLIGTDLLGALRLDLAFRGRRRIRVSRSRRTGDGFFEARRATTRLVRAIEQRFGDLLMIEIQVGGVTASAILDTGAQVSIANLALTRSSGALPIRLRDGRTSERVRSPTGRVAEATPVMIPNLRFGGITIGRLPILTGDFHTFDLWGVSDRPALLMGVDILGLFERVAIDLKRGEVVFEV